MTAELDTSPAADPVVAAALAPLPAAAELPPEQQLDVYAAAHRALQAALDTEIS